MDLKHKDRARSELDHSQRDIELALSRLEKGSAWRRGFSLRLYAGLEDAWRRDHSKASVRLIQGSMALTFAFYSIYWLTTQVGLAPPVDRQLVYIFLTFGIPGNSVLLAATLMRTGWKYLRLLTVGGVLFHTVGLYFFFDRAAEIGWKIGPSLLFIQILFDLYALGLIWTDAALLVGAALLIAPTAMRSATMSESESITTLFFISAAAVVGCMGAYMAEHARRTGWLREQLLTKIAERDALTQLLNHGAFLARAERVLAHARRVRAPLSMLVLDVDHFKRINDDFGHPVGDTCLKLVAAAVAAEGRRPLDLAGRLGGEEFGLVLFDATPSQAFDRSDAIREQIRSAMNPSGRQITVSIGLCNLYPAADITIDRLIAFADRLLYQAKNAGRDRVVAGLLGCKDAVSTSITAAKATATR